MNGSAENDEWEFAGNVLEWLERYLFARREENQEMFDWSNSSDQYLLGFGDGFKAGFDAAFVMACQAGTKASAHEYLLDPKDSRKLAALRDKTPE